ncbi:hypothetical protein MU852_04160 [Brevundimonas albigilva]|uniref:HGGxSTG domain-containing protein n=1 Tax=Brevundimonas albigilva TaxID=1312364 RepID=UPI00201B52BA|nr:HGGxSTG domain-containing protein [Brevundimonas albigilva]UQV19065.1 hypothetical protein MU852_04160 [Brevundimonas albigilva]
MSKRQKAPAKAAPILPTEKEAANIQLALDQSADRPKRIRPPATTARYLGPNRVEVGPPHDDRAGWAKALGASLGVDSPGVASILMASASAIMGELAINSQEDADAHMAREMRALEFVSAIRPETTLEATLAVQMLGAHEASMLMMRGVHKAKTVQQQADYVRLMNQSMRTFTAQVDALTKLRTGGKQQMEVRYVYVDARSQTVIGGYPAGEGEGPVRQSEISNKPMHPVSEPLVMRLRAACRCGARTRAGTPCQAPAIRGKRRCRMHGGRSTGAPKGEANGNYQTGAWTQETIQARATVRAFVRMARKQLDDLW